MELSRSIVRQFADLTNTDNSSKITEDVYGRVRELNGQFYAQIDGSEADILTPISSTIDIKDGDRVIIEVRNHIATATGNLDDPAAGLLRVNDMGELVIQAKTIFEGLSDGTTIIDGGCIQTGTIDAERINLTGVLTFNDFIESDKEKLENAGVKFQYSPDGENDWHDTMESTDYYRRESVNGADWGDPYQFRGKDGENGDDATIPTYITETIIGSGMVQAPQIYANDLNIYPSDASDYYGSLNIYGGVNGVSGQFHMLSIMYDGHYDVASQVPHVDFCSPGGGNICFNKNDQTNGLVEFYGTVNFTNATVTGLYMTFS